MVSGVRHICVQGCVWDRFFGLYCNRVRIIWGFHELELRKEKVVQLCCREWNNKGEKGEM